MQCMRIALTRYSMFALVADSATITGSVIPSSLHIGLRVCAVAVAVRAITLTYLE